MSSKSGQAQLVQQPSYESGGHQAAPNGRNYLKPIQGASLGVPVPQGLGMPEQQGNYLGFGTFVNSDKNFFRNTALIPITEQVANDMNVLLDELLNQRIEGNHGLASFNEEDDIVYYLPNITEYRQDDLASIAVGDTQAFQGSDAMDEEEGVPAYLIFSLPGSDEATEAAKAGVGTGQVRVATINNKTGKVKVGGPTWRSSLIAWSNGRIPGVSLERVHHSLGQAGVYGFGDIFYNHDIDVNFDEQDGVVRYYIGNGTDEAAHNFIRNSSLMRDIENRYKMSGIDPAGRNRGQYASALLALGHLDKLATRSGGDALQDEQRSRKGEELRAAFAQNGTVKGQFHYARDSTTAGKRRGMVKIPHIDAQGNPRMEASKTTNMTCSPLYSGPGITQSANRRKTGKYAFALTPKSRYHISKSRTNPGIPTSDPNYVCSTTQFINPYRQDLYGPSAPSGGEEGIVETINKRHKTLMQAYGQDIANEFSPEDLGAGYYDWVEHPEHYGTNPYFMTENGFLISEPSSLAAHLPPHLQTAFNQLQLKDVPKLKRYQDYAETIRGAVRVQNRGAVRGQKKATD